MNAESPVTLRRLNYRGVPDFHLSWEEDGQAREAGFLKEEDAVVEMAAIEQRLRVAAAAGKGLTVNPFGEAKPFITSKDVHFASLRLQPRGLNFRDAIEDYVDAAAAVKPLDVSVARASREYAEAATALEPFEVSVTQAVFEWVELKKQVGDLPLFELLRAHAARKAGPTATAAPTPKPGLSEISAPTGTESGSKRS